MWTIEKIQEGTECLVCNTPMDEWGDKMDGTDKITCDHCNCEFEFHKQFQFEPSNPYCDYAWNKTYFVFINNREFEKEEEILLYEKDFKPRV